jgi:hypothetical protein
LPTGAYIFGYLVEKPGGMPMKFAKNIFNHADIMKVIFHK